MDESAMLLMYKVQVHTCMILRTVHMYLNVEYHIIIP